MRQVEERLLDSKAVVDKRKKNVQSFLSGEITFDQMRNADIRSVGSCYTSILIDIYSVLKNMTQDELDQISAEKFEEILRNLNYSGYYDREDGTTYCAGISKYDELEIWIEDIISRMKPESIPLYYILSDEFRFGDTNCDRTREFSSLIVTPNMSLTHPTVMKYLVLVMKCKVTTPIKRKIIWKYLEGIIKNPITTTKRSLLLDIIEMFDCKKEDIKHFAPDIYSSELEMKKLLALSLKKSYYEVCALLM
jgi:hypothetical protein